MTDHSETTIHPPASLPAGLANLACRAVRGMPRLLLRLEAVAVFCLAVAGYARLGEGFREFALLFLAPDLSLAGYLAGQRTGALFYNSVHSYIVPMAMLGVACIAYDHFLLSVALIWIAHIGLDRMLGYGLKYGTSFADTHLGRVGRQKASQRGTWLGLQ
jgi:hypothetical protein